MARSTSEEAETGIDDWMDYCVGHCCSCASYFVGVFVVGEGWTFQSARERWSTGWWSIGLKGQILNYDRAWPGSTTFYELRIMMYVHSLNYSEDAG